jgi:hypothetical protein
MMPFIIAFVVFAVVMALLAWLARRNDDGPADRSAGGSFMMADSSAINDASVHSGADCSSSHSVDSGSCGH